MLVECGRRALLLLERPPFPKSARRLLLTLYSFSTRRHSRPSPTYAISNTPVCSLLRLFFPLGSINSSTSERRHFAFLESGIHTTYDLYLVYLVGTLPSASYLQALPGRSARTPCPPPECCPEFLIPCPSVLVFCEGSFNGGWNGSMEGREAGAGGIGQVQGLAGVRRGRGSAGGNKT